MKKLILFLSLILSVGFASAQSEIPSDSIRRAPSTNIKEFGGFLLDMGLMNVFLLRVCRFWIRIWLGIVFFSTVYADGIFQTEKRNENQYLRRLQQGWLAGA